MTYNQLTTDDFIKKAREIHGDKYDYSKVEYVNSHTKVCIICPEHGEFWQTPNGHLCGRGCPKCTNPNHGLTTEEFIQKAREVHGDKYDYSKVEYKGVLTKVCIICPKHGEFWQIAREHLGGQGCPKCSGKNKTTEDFVKEARKVHGDKYDYSKVEYKGVFTKVCIICPEHGEFWQIPSSHLKGRGCPKCSGKNKTTEDFVKEARKIHGDKYDYSKVEYVDSRTKVCIICPKHGEFWQTPPSHLSGVGCPKCGGSLQLTTEEFIQKAREVHGDKYDYSKVEYVNGRIKIPIICPVHGEFWQTGESHLSGCGCPNCQGLRKEYKFNLLQEFESEYSFRAFLENNDENILYIILRNIEPKYDPIKKDIEKALDRSFDENPIKALEEKYSSESDDEIDDEEWAESESTTETTTMAEIDLDDDDAVEAMLSNDKQESVKEEEHSDPTIEDVIKNTEQEIKVINKIEHLLTPEDRKYIMDKFLNDKRRAWMLNREESVK